MDHLVNEYNQCLINKQDEEVEQLVNIGNVIDEIGSCHVERNVEYESFTQEEIGKTVLIDEETSGHDFNEEEELFSNESSSLVSISESLCSDLSLNPPDTMPILVINLEELCGCPITSKTENELKKKEITASLLGESSLEKEEKASLGSLNFQHKYCELFRSQIAIHGDTSLKIMNSDKDWKWCFVRYPSFIEIEGNLKSVSQLWKYLLHYQYHDIPVVEKILSHVPNVSQPLSWKVDMIKSIRQLAHTERKEKERRDQRKDLNEWRIVRNEKLKKLYQIHEVFKERLLESQRDLKYHVDIREIKVSQQMNILYGVTTEGSSNHFLPLDDQSFYSPTSSDDESQNSDDSSTTSNSSHVDFEHKIPIPGLLPKVKHEHRKIARLKASQKKRRHRRLIEEHQSKLLHQKQILAEKKSKEDELRNQFRTLEENRLQMKVLSFEKQLHKIDQLLETLQTEVWEDEDSNVINQTTVNVTSLDKEQFSLLDQILAMILGSLPAKSLLGLTNNDNVIVREDNLQNHYCKQYQVHNQILKEWMGYFGRLPALPSSEKVENNKVLINENLDEDISCPYVPGNLGEPVIPSSTVDLQLDSFKTIDISSNPSKGLRPCGRLS